MEETDCVAKRTLSEYAQIAEVVSAMAVVASLIYVGYEIHQNTEQQKTEAKIQAQRIWYQFTDAALQNSELFGLGGQTYNPSKKLSDFEGVQEIRARLFVRASLGRYQELFFRYQAGQLSELEWERRSGVLAGFLRDLPVWREAWERDLPVMSPEFVQDIQRATPIRFENFMGE